MRAGGTIGEKLLKYQKVVVSFERVLCDFEHVLSVFKGR